MKSQANRIHPDRTSGGNRHHRGVDWSAGTRRSKSS
jgi:hypothetical protein